MNYISIYYPYIGKLNKYNIFSLNQIAQVESFNIYLIIEKNNKSDLSKLSDKINVLFLEDVFSKENNLNIKIEDLLNHPYKLCDYRPFFNKLFNVDFTNFWGFGDLDCIYNSVILSELASKIDNDFAVYGDRGHLTIFGQSAIEIIQKELVEKIKYFNEKGIDLLDARKGYAIDEHRFLHVICDYLDKSKTIKWEKEFFYPYFDVDYKNIIPKNLKITNYKFSIKSILTAEGESCNLSYIHLQKRKIESKKNIYNGYNYLNFSGLNGNVIFDDSINDKYKNVTLISTCSFYVKVFFKRVKYRIYNYGFFKRPSL